MQHWKKQISLLWCCQFLSIAAMEMSEPFWPLFLNQLSPNNGQITLWSALIYSAPLLISSLVAPYWGILGDRYGHKKMVLRATLGLSVTQGLLYFASELWHVLALRLLQGALAGVITAILCFANHITPTIKRSVVIGNLTSATAAGAILGPFVGGVLIQWLNFVTVFALASAICFAITLALSIGLQASTPKPPSQQNQHSSRKVTKKITGLIGLGLLTIFLLQAAKALPSSFFALYAEQYLTASPFIIGLLFSAAGVGMMLSAPIWGKRFEHFTHVNKPLVLAGIAMAASACYLLHIQTNLLLLLLVRFIWGLCLGALLPMLQALMITFTEEYQHGTLIGRAQRFIKLGNLVGVSAGALLIIWWDYAIGFIVAAILYIGVAIALFAIRSKYQQGH
ncbi:MFS transporter [Marinomonas agarivorans]|nr:MFS transporter [Marinomonas agarivorans]